MHPTHLGGEDKEGNACHGKPTQIHGLSGEESCQPLAEAVDAQH
jgi:hypothetical protein